MPRKKNKHTIACVRFSATTSSVGIPAQPTVCPFEQVHHRGEAHEVFWNRFGPWCETCPASILKTGGVDYWQHARRLADQKPNAV